MYYKDFLLNLYNYVVGAGNCNNNIIRKNTRNLKEVGEFSCSMEILNYHKVKSNLTSKSQSDLEEIKEQLVKESSSWQLQISKCVLLNSNLHIFVDRVSTFEKVIQQTLEQGPKYGSCSVSCKRKLCIATTLTEQELCNLNLSQLRLLILRDVTNRMLEFGVFENSDDDATTVYLSVQAKKDEKEVILCAPVVSVRNNLRSSINAEEFYRKRTIDMRLMAQHKYGLRITSDAGWQEFFEKLGQAAVTIDLLQNKPSRAVAINLNDPVSSNNKGASFILYNCARLATLFKEFDKRVSDNIYPALPSLESVNFVLLTQPEEWELLFTYVLQFPNVVETCTMEILDRKIGVHNLCSALFGMCSTFSMYYRRVRVLTEPRAHLFATLHARIYLLKAVEQVLHNCLHLLNIQPVKQM